MHILGTHKFGYAFYPLQAHGAHLGIINKDVLHFIVSFMRAIRISLIRDS